MPNVTLPEDTMTPAHCFKSRSLVLATVLVCGLGLFTHANAQIRHAFLVDLNNRSATEIGRSTLENPSYVSGINDAGQVVGQSVTAEGGWHAFITGPDGMGMRQLGNLGESWSQSFSYDVNNAGQVVGTDPTGPPRAFITGPDGVGMRDLGSLGGGWSYARGINDAGQVVGDSGAADGVGHAFVTGPDGMGMRDLGTLGGQYSYANGVNEAGPVVGVSATAEGN
jgi:probable HAF family extracellular repeat protein